MSDLFKLLLPLLVIVGVLAFLLSLFKTGRKVSSINYKKVDRLFTKAERSFLGVLAQAVGDQYQIMGKVRLSDVIKPGGKNDQSGWQSA